MMNLVKPLPISLGIATIGIAALLRILAANRVRLAQARHDLTKIKASSSSHVPVAIFVGGTAGIGCGMALAFARQTNGNSHIILVGRNEASAKAVISKFPKPTVPGAKHEFVYCDATLMKNIDKTTKDLRSRLPKINFLVLSTMDVRSMSRENTEEGIDSMLALIYYGRFKFTRDLTPALESAKSKGEDAKVYMVAGPGRGKYIDWNDLGLKRTPAFFNEFRAQAPIYLDIILQELTARSPSLIFVNADPGTVRTNLGSHSAWPMPIILKLIYFFKYPWTLSYSESGEYMLRAMLTTAKSPGTVWSVGQDGRVLPGGLIHKASEEERTRLWEHSVAETSITDEEGTTRTLRGTGSL